jgi:hypothetical protein
MDLAHDAKSLTLALDLAETIGAKNSMEAMLAHQLAAVHRGSMRLRFSSIEKQRHSRLRATRPIRKPRTFASRGW